MARDGLDVSELSAFADELGRAARNAPQKAKRLMQTQGTRLKAKTSSFAKQRVKKKTGNYLKSIKRGKVYTYRSDNTHAIRVYSAAPHAHLIESGHRVVSHGYDAGFQPGKHVFEDARKAYQPTFERACEDFLDEVAREVEF